MTHTRTSSHTHTRIFYVGRLGGLWGREGSKTPIYIFENKYIKY
jgi:hypothetical protein